MTQALVPYLDHLVGYYGPAHAAGLPALAGSPMPGFAPVFAPALGGGGYGRPNVHVVATTPEAIQELRRNENEDRENSRGTMAAVAGGIIAIVLAGVSAVAGRNLLNTSKELKRAVAFRDQELPNLPQDVRNQLQPISNKHIEILESKAFWSKSFAALTVSALASAVAAFVGGMFTIPWLITAAVVAGVAITATGVFSGVWYMTEDHSLSQGMLEQIEALRNQYRA